jgi:general secretion pathway protein G
MPLHARRAARGFTLIEIMVVVVILGILATLVAPAILGKVDDARIAKAQQDIRAMETALDLYRLDNYKYPSTDQGLQALVTKPEDPAVKNWKPGGYIKQLMTDPWGNDYLYLEPGTHGQAFDLWTMGADGQEGGEDAATDIGNWALK